MLMSSELRVPGHSVRQRSAGWEKVVKILLISSSSGSHGGGEFYLRELAASLAVLGHEPTTWMSHHMQMNPLAEGFTSRGLHLRRFHYVNTYHRRLRSFGAVLDRSLQRRLANEFNQSGADVIHLNLQCLEDALDLLLAASQCAVPVVATVHVTHSARNLGARGGVVRDALSRRILRTAQIPLIAVSNPSATDLCRFLGVSAVRAIPGGSYVRKALPVYSVANGVSTPTTGDALTLRRSVGLGASDFVLGVVARLEQQKNPLFMCRLLEQLPSRVHCVWIGDGRLRSRLEAEIAGLKLQHRFHLAGWKENATEWFSAFDVFCLPSLYEGLPLALLEAMSAGLPCVVSDVDGTRDAIDQSVSGFRCTVNDVQSWQDSLTALIALPELCSRIGDAARTRHAAEFSIEAMTQRTIAVYGDVILRRRAARNE